MFEFTLEGFKIATTEDKPLVCLTLAQAFADYNYPIPSVDNSYSARLALYYELGSEIFDNTINCGFILCNEDYSAVMLVTDAKKMADYDISKLANIYISKGEPEAAKNMLGIFNYILKMEDDLDMNDYDLYIEMFAVQTPKQGNKLGSKLMRELFRNCDIEKKNLLLYTNTDRNVSIYKHFGFEIVLEKHVDELNSDTYFLARKHAE